MKTILLLGDSIRQNYLDYVIDNIGDGYTVLSPNDNCKNTATTLRYIHEWVRALTGSRGGTIDLVHFNCGLWDVIRLSNEERTFTEISYYVDMLDRIYERIKFCCPNAKTIFATSTPVIEPGFGIEGHDASRKNSDIEAFNKAATDLFKGKNIPINDLWAVAKSIGKEAHSDFVHYETEIGIKTLGEAVIKKCKEVLG